MANGHRTSTHVYGPVPSRRLGRSLGVDLVPFKICPYDCMYCQLGRTTEKTLLRAEYVPLDEVVADLEERLASHPGADFIGLAGSGEPTLHAGIGDLIAAIKRITDIPVAVLTNGALLWMPEVRQALARADLVLPSLDAGTPAAFQRVNRPVAGLDFAQMVEGLVAFTADFRGKTWLEVFVMRGITDTHDEIDRIAALVDRIRPDRVQLNTAARPTAEPGAFEAPRAQLASLCQHFRVPCEVIAQESRPTADPCGIANDVGAGIVALLARRPCTVAGIATGLGMAPNDVIKQVDVLVGRGLLVVERRDDAVFYRTALRPDGTAPSEEVGSDGDVILSLGEDCVRKAARRAYDALVSAAADSPEPDPDPIVGGAARLLARFLESTDFAALRAAHPKLAGGTVCRVRLSWHDTESVGWAIVEPD